MKVLIVYDSVYGNTAKIAKALAVSIPGEARVLRATEVGPSDLDGADLLVVGSPTHDGRPTPAVMDFIGGIPDSGTGKLSAAAFDTRQSSVLGGIFGRAAGEIAASLRIKGIRVVASEGFLVEGREGPLRQGEQERAMAWANDLTSRN